MFQINIRSYMPKTDKLKTFVTKKYILALLSICIMFTVILIIKCYNIKPPQQTINNHIVTDHIQVIPDQIVNDNDIDLYNNAINTAIDILPKEKIVFSTDQKYIDFLNASRTAKFIEMNLSQRLKDRRIGYFRIYILFIDICYLGCKSRIRSSWPKEDVTGSGPLIPPG